VRKEIEREKGGGHLNTCVLQLAALTSGKRNEKKFFQRNRRGAKVKRQGEGKEAKELLHERKQRRTTGVKLPQKDLLGVRAGKGEGKTRVLKEPRKVLYTNTVDQVPPQRKGKGERGPLQERTPNPRVEALLKGRGISGDSGLG